MGSSDRVALITGIAGQDGSLLARLLIEKGYRVTGTTRRSPQADLWRIKELGIEGHAHLQIRALDLADAFQCAETVAALMPHEVYNFGGRSFIGDSFADPVGTANITGLGVWNLLEAIRTKCPLARFFQASSSEMFDCDAGAPQDEESRMLPRSPYAASKHFGHGAATIYREKFGIFSSSGILFNHESPLRGIDFVTQKIAHGVACIALGRQEEISLGNLDSMRDWGYAPEYVEGMWRILQAASADTFVLATGRLTSVRSFVESAFSAIEVRILWRGHGIGEVGFDAASGKIRVRVSADFLRPEGTNVLQGDAAKAQRLLGWTAITKADEICRIMVDADLRRLRPGTKN